MRYTVLVKPGVSKDEVMVDDDSSALIVRTRKRAHDGEANKAVVELLSDYFGVAKSRVVIVKGATGRKKIVDVI